MKLPAMPAAGWPWEVPGYTFSTGWPPGFVPPVFKASPVIDPREAAARSRQTSLARGQTGTIKGLSGNAGVRQDASKGLVKRSHKAKPKEAA